MTQIVLVRPGSTDYDQQQRIQGDLDVPLNPAGSEEVARITEQLRGLPIEAVYAPCCEPARETGKLIAKALGLRCRKLDRMTNLNHGLWQGMRIEEVRRKYPRVYRQWQEQPENIQPPEGETLEQAGQRLKTAMAKLLKKHKEGTIALVLPEPMASLVRRFLDQGDLGDLWKAVLSHGRWELCEMRSTVVA